MADSNRGRRMSGRGKERVESSRNLKAGCEGNAASRRSGTSSRRASSPLFGDLAHARDNLVTRSTEKKSSKPMKMLIAEEISKEVASRRHSPSIIARLMGLDALPAQQAAVRHKKKSESSSQKVRHNKLQRQLLKNPSYQTTDESIIERRNSHESDISLRTSLDHQEFKDVFEVQEAPRLRKFSHSSPHSSTASAKPSDVDMAFIREKFTDAKRLSTDDKLRNSREFSDALEALDSKKDLLLRFLEDRESLFTSHLESLRTVPPQPTHITVLRASENGSPYKVPNNYSRREVRHRSSKTHQERVKCSGEYDPEDEEYPVHLRNSLPLLTQMPVKQETGPNFKATKIVVLKPNHQRSEPEVSGPLDDHSSFDLRRRKELQESSNYELHEESMDWNRSHRSRSRQRGRSEERGSKGSRQIAKEVTRKLTDNVTKRSTSMPSGSSLHFDRQESTHRLAGQQVSDHSRLFPYACKHFHDWDRKFISTSSAPIDSPMRKEAKKHLSERWKLTQNSGESGYLGRSSCTLGEMLNLPETTYERGKQAVTLGDMIGQGTSYNSLAGKEVLEYWSDGNESRAKISDPPPSLADSFVGYDDSRRYDMYFNIDGSVGHAFSRETCSLGASSSAGRTHTRNGSSSVRKRRSSSRKSRLSAGEVADSCGQNSFPLRCDYPFDHVIGSNEENLSHLPYVKHQLVDCERDPIHGKDYHLNHESSLELPFKCDDKFLIQEVEQYTHIDSKESNYRLSPAETNSLPQLPDHPSVPSTLDQSPAEPKEITLHSEESPEQPSPVSVLETAFDEELSGSDCFEKLSADLAGLRKQLRLLKRDDGDNYDSDCRSSDNAEHMEVSEDECDHAQCAFENREFYFVQDVLDMSGFHGESEMLLKACYTPNSPLNPGILEELHEKYNVPGKQDAMKGKGVSSMSRADTKLFFDQINACLVKILGPWLEVRPWMKTVPGRRYIGGKQWLVDEILKIIQQPQTANFEADSVEMIVQKGFGGDSSWAQLGDDVDLIGSEIEVGLVDLLIEELICEFFA